MKISRRQMLVRTTQSLAVLGLSTELAPLFAAPQKRGFKIGACEWSLGKCDPSSLEVAKEIGLDGVQVTMGTAANKMWLRQPEMQKAYRQAAKKNGVEIAGLAIGELNLVPLKSEPHTALWLYDALSVARALGVKVVMPAQFAKGDLVGDQAGIDRTVEVLKEIAPRAKEAGIIVGIENYLSAEENLKILDKVGSPSVQVYYDVGNSTDKGYDVYKEIRMLKGRVCEFHFKDAGFLLGQGRIDFAKVREAIDEIGYRGWIQIEAAAPNGLVKDYKTNLAFLRGIFPKNG